MSKTKDLQRDRSCVDSNSSTSEISVDMRLYRYLQNRFDTISRYKIGLHASLTEHMLKWLTTQSLYLEYLPHEPQQTVYSLSVCADDVSYYRKYGNALNIHCKHTASRLHDDVNDS